MKFILRAAALLVVLVAASLARAQTTPISFYYPVAVGGPVTKIIDSLVADFEKEHPSIKVTPIYSGTYKESAVKALTAFKNGMPPATAVLFAADMYTLIDAHAVVPFEELATTAEDQAWLRAFYPAFMANSRAAGKTWGIPFQRSTILLYWNKDLFRRAGLDPERAPADWQEMAAFARQLTQRDARGEVVRWGIQIPGSGFPYWLFQGLAAANGAELMNAAGTETHFDHPAAIAALDYWVGLASRHGVHPPGVVDWGTTPSDFIGQKVAMIWTTSGNLANIRKSAPFPFGVAMLPASQRRGSPTGGGNFYIFRKSSPQQQQAAFAFVKWITAPRRAAQWSIATGYIAVQPQAWQVQAMAEHAAAFPSATVGRDQLAHAVPEFSTHENQRVTKVLNKGLTAALLGKKTPAEALQDAQADAMRILLPYQR